MPAHRFRLAPHLMAPLLAGLLLYSSPTRAVGLSPQDSYESAEAILAWAKQATAGRFSEGFQSFQLSSGSREAVVVVISSGSGIPYSEVFLFGRTSPGPFHFLLRRERAAGVLAAHEADDGIEYLKDGKPDGWLSWIGFELLAKAAAGEIPPPTLRGLTLVGRQDDDCKRVLDSGKPAAKPPGFRLAPETALKQAQEQARLRCPSKLAISLYADAEYYYFVPELVVSGLAAQGKDVSSATLQDFVRVHGITGEAIPRPGSTAY